MTDANEIRLSYYESAYDSTPKQLELSWGDLAEWLTTHNRTPCTTGGAACANKTCSHKFGAAWSPSDYGDNEDARRDNDLVKFITVAVVDLDHLPADKLEQVAHAIEGYAYIFHSTHCHQPPGSGSYRLVMQLSAPVPAKAWPGMLNVLIDFLALPSWVEVVPGKNGKPRNLIKGADRVCKDLSRLYFLPSAPEGTEVVAEVGVGVPLDVTSLLERARTASPPSKAPPVPASLLVQPGEPPRVLPVVGSELEQLRKHVMGRRLNYLRSMREGDKDRGELLSRVVYGQALADEGARDNTVNQAATLIAQSVPLETSADAVIALMQASLSAMPLDPEGLDHWIERARFSYERAIERRTIFEAEHKERNDKLRNTMLSLTGGGGLPGSGDIPAITPAELEANPDAWRQRLIVTLDKAGNESIVSCGHNATVILAYAPECRTSFRFNLVTKTIEVHESSAEPCPFIGEHASSLDVAVTDWLFSKYQVKLKSHEAGERIARVARMNAFDPMAEYLRGLQWDGVRRAPTFLIDYAGARTVDELGRDVTEYVQKVSERFVISLAARWTYPGCKVDTVLVLEGAQGLKKSTLFDVLGGAWFDDSPLSLGDRDAMMRTSRSGLIELAELAALRRSETESQKAFLSNRRDTYRVPYGRAVETFERRCVFVGTTNAQDGYLIDPTGHRRYWPIRCVGTPIDIAGLRAVRDQLFAEALFLLHTDKPRYPRPVGHEQGVGERWWFDESENEQTNQVTESRVVESSTTEIISDWWYAMPKDKRGDLRVHEVAIQALKTTPDRITKSVEMDIAATLRRMGFVKRLKRRGQLVASFWEPTDDLKSAIPTKTGSLLQAVTTQMGGTTP